MYDKVMRNGKPSPRLNKPRVHEMKVIRNRRIKELYDSGTKPAVLCLMFQLSRQRLHQIIACQ